MRRLNEMIFLAAVTFSFPCPGSHEVPIFCDRLLMAGFQKDESVKAMGVSDSNPMDENQSIKMSLVEEDALGKPGGKSLRLDYDVDSYEKAKVEFWIEFNEIDLSRFDTLHFYLRGDSEKGFTRMVTVQMVDGENRQAPYIVTGIGSQWKEFKIPFKRFSRIRDWSHIKTLEFVFDDVFSNPKEGSIFVDEIYVSKQR